MTETKPQRKAGYLWCNECRATFPFQGPGEPHEWPLHRCVAGRIRPLDHWTPEDPAKTPLPKGTF